MSRASKSKSSVAAPVASAVSELASVPVAHSNSLLRPKEAATFLTISLRSLQARAEIPRVDMSPIGSQRAMWRYRRADLEDYIAKRTIAPFRHEAFA